MLKDNFGNNRHTTGRLWWPPELCW